MVRVLIVDDEAEVRDALRRGLEVMGFSIQTAVDGVAGVAEAESWHTDVVLLDLAMPRMSGLSALKQIRGWPQVPVIVLSVMGEEADKSSCPGRGRGRLHDQTIRNARASGAHSRGLAPYEGRTW